MNARILKWTVPVDDQSHPIGSGKVVHSACQGGPGVVQVWTMETPKTLDFVRYVQVFGTGQPLGDAVEHVGSALAQGLVWHVMEVPA